MSLHEGLTTAAVVHFIPAVKWGQRNSAPYLCGAGPSSASTDKASVTCGRCIALMNMDSSGPGVEPPTPHTPPDMGETSDGVFHFYGTHSDLGGAMEVIPMATGNVEFEIIDPGTGKGVIFNLHHLDRADMIRALLHDFHYSPERGGPNDDQD